MAGSLLAESLGNTGGIYVGSQAGAALFDRKSKHLNAKLERATSSQVLIDFLEQLKRSILARQHLSRRCH